MAQQHLLDAILLDLFMPGMNGWETLQGLKSNVATAAIPVVVLSVFTSRQYESDDIREVHGWVNKPFSQHSLLTAVGSALEPGNTNTSIVLVENDNDQAALITSTFASSGLTVYRATSRQQALRLCQTIQPRLMVLNLALPNDDGMQIVSWLRQHDELHKMPLVVYSGREISNEDLELITQGPAQFMERSRVQPAEVAQLVLNMLRRQRNNTASAAFETKALLATESGGRTRAS
jgi:CheY-like chemotaxis protein